MIREHRPPVRRIPVGQVDERIQSWIKPDYRVLCFPLSYDPDYFQQAPGMQSADPVLFLIHPPANSVFRRGGCRSNNHQRHIRRRELADESREELR
jgi:hypothetical protein